MSGFDFSTKIQMSVIHYSSHRFSKFGQRPEVLVNLSLLSILHL